MHRFRKGLSAALAAVLVFMLCAGMIPAAAAEVILDPNHAHGGDYTQSDQLAKALDQVFSGDVDVYSDAACSVEVSMPLGTRMDNSTQYYVKSKTTGNKISGWQCYIYANAVYNRLFHEWVGHASGFAHSEKVVSGGGNALSYAILSNAGVRCGAYLRTTGNSDGSYNGSVGHSMIILAYDQSSITYLEGNGDGNGLVRISTRTWSDFNVGQLSGRSRYISHIVQPKAAFYEQMYPVCSHGQYDGMGVCSSCGQSFDWQSTFFAGAAGQYQVKAEISLRSGQPYDAVTPTAQVLYPGQLLEVTGSYHNAFGEQWYCCTGADNNRYFVKSDYLELVEYLTLQVVCTDFSPADGAVLEQKAQPVKGTVTANYPIKAIFAYLDGDQYATWTASDQYTMTVNLQATDINYNLSFSTMAQGHHTITLKLQSVISDEPVTIHESGFYMEGQAASCNHNYRADMIREPTCTMEGLRTYTCTLCADSYTEALPANGHDYVNGTCSECGLISRVTLMGTVESFFGETTPTVVFLRKGNTTVTETVISGLKEIYIFRDLEVGEYTVEIRKEGGASRTFTLKLESGTVTQDVVIYQLGDVTCDGRVDMGDTAQLYAHVRNTAPITQRYPLQCADVNGDGIVNIGDVGKLYSKIKGRI